MWPYYNPRCMLIAMHIDHYSVMEKPFVSEVGTILLRFIQEVSEIEKRLTT